jgi:hypothetical protein
MMLSDALYVVLRVLAFIPGVLITGIGAALVAVVTLVVTCQPETEWIKRLTGSVAQESFRVFAFGVILMVGWREK